MEINALNTLTWILTYIAYTVWAVLLVALFTGLLKKNRALLKRALKYLINSSVFLVAWVMILELALIVRAPIYATREASVNALRDMVTKTQVKDFYTALAAIIVLFAINLFFYYKLENKRFSKDLFILILGDSMVLALGIWLTGELAFAGLLQEINRYFG